MPILDVRVTVHLSPILEAWLSAEASTNSAAIARIEAAILQEKTTMSALETAITDLQTRVEANTTVIGSASVLIRGFAQQLADAIAAATAAGATAAQLAQLNALKSAVQASDDDLAAAISANTDGGGQP